MTSNSSLLLEQARRGQVTAIADLLNQSLRSQNLTATVERKGLTITIVVTGDEPPEPAIAARIEPGLRQIQPALTKAAIIYGQRSGDLVPQWSETVDLRPQPSIPDSAPALPPDSAEPADLGGYVAHTLARQQANQPTPRTAPPLEPFQLGRLLTWEAGLLVGLLIPFINTFLLWGYILGLRPLALQAGTVLVTGGRWRVSYATVFGSHIAFWLIFLVFYGLIGRSLFVNAAIARGILFIVISIVLYGSLLRLPNQDGLGFWRTAGAVLFMEAITQIPLRLMTEFVLEPYVGSLEQLEQFLR